MADITVATQDAVASSSQGRSSRTLIFTTASIGYFFYIDTNDDLLYTKTTDGGQTWGSGVTVRTGTVTSVGCWFDQWTTGDSGTKIHVWYNDSSDSTTRYRSLDTNGDTLGAEATLLSGTGYTTGQTIHINGAKTRGGNLLVAFHGRNVSASSTNSGLYRSTDGGGTWGSRTTVFESTTGDFAFVFPGNESDNQDAWVLFLDSSSNELSLKTYDDSANTISETFIVACNDNTTDGISQFSLSGSIRHSDGHLICVASTFYDDVAGDTVVYDINGSGSITAKTNIHTAADDVFYMNVMIDQNTDHIYVGYIGKTDSSETLGAISAKAYYAKSTNGGTSWSVDNAYSEETTETRRQTYMPLSGNRMAFAWRSPGTIIQSNYANSLDLTPAATGGPFPHFTRRSLRGGMISLGGGLC